LSAIFFKFKYLFVSLANLNKKKEDFKKEGKRDFGFCSLLVVVVVVVGLPF